MTSKTQSCSTCGEPAGPEGHLCSPGHLEGEPCEWCGAVIPDQRHLCADKVKRLAYICNSCGRAAVRPEYLCRPEKVE